MREVYRPIILRLIIKKILFFFFFLLATIVSLFFIGIVEDLIIFIIITLLGIISFLYLLSIFISIKSFKTVRYIVSDKNIVFEKDLMVREKTTLPLNQITNVSYTKTWILDAIFKTGSVYVFTAGSASYDVKMRSVLKPQKIYEKLNSILHYDLSQEIDDYGNFVGRKSPFFKKRLKPIPIFPTLGAILGVPLALILTGFPFVLLSMLGSVLASGETLYAFLILLGFIALLGIWLGFVFLTYKAYKRRYYDFYTNKIEYYDGFLTKRKATVPIERITNISNTQSLFGILFGFHTLLIETAGSSGPEITIGYIKEGKEVVEELQEVLEKHGRN